jgi:hypothetical protein
MYCILQTRFAREDKVKEYNIGKPSTTTPPNRYSVDVELLVAGAMTLLAYFHYCNKGIFPFSDECRDQDLRGLAELEQPMIDFVQDSKRRAGEYSKPSPIPDRNRAECLQSEGLVVPFHQDEY